MRSTGEVDERFKSHAWKACVGLSPPRVRIPPSPPSITTETIPNQVGDFSLANYFLSPSDLNTPVTVSETESKAEVKVEQPVKPKESNIKTAIDNDLKTCDMGILAEKL